MGLRTARLAQVDPQDAAFVGDGDEQHVRPALGIAGARRHLDVLRAAVSGCADGRRRGVGVNLDRRAIERKPDRLARPVARWRHYLQRVELAARQVIPPIGHELEDVTAGSARSHRRRRGLRNAVDVSLRVEADALARLQAERRTGSPRQLPDRSRRPARQKPTAAPPDPGATACGLAASPPRRGSVPYGVHTMPSIQFQSVQVNRRVVAPAWAATVAIAGPRPSRRHAVLSAASQAGVAAQVRLRRLDRCWLRLQRWADRGLCLARSSPAGLPVPQAREVS